MHIVYGGIGITRSNMSQGAHVINEDISVFELRWLLLWRWLNGWRWFVRCSITVVAVFRFMMNGWFVPTLQCTINDGINGMNIAQISSNMGHCHGGYFGRMDGSRCCSIMIGSFILVGRDCRPNHMVLCMYLVWLFDGVYGSPIFIWNDGSTVSTLTMKLVYNLLR